LIPIASCPNNPVEASQSFCRHGSATSDTSAPLSQSLDRAARALHLWTQGYSRRSHLYALSLTIPQMLKPKILNDHTHDICFCRAEAENQFCSALVNQFRMLFDLVAAPHHHAAHCIEVISAQNLQHSHLRSLGIRDRDLRPINSPLIT